MDCENSERTQHMVAKSARARKAAVKVTLTLILEKWASNYAQTTKRISIKLDRESIKTL